MADIKKIIEIEYKLANGDTVTTTNEKVIQQFVELGEGYKVTKTAADELSASNQTLAETTAEVTQATEENTQAITENADAQQDNAGKGKKLEKQTSDTGKSMKSLKAQLADAKSEMAAAAANFGEGSVQFAEASAKAGALKDQIESFNRTLEASKSPLDAAIGSLQGIAGAYGIAQSASALFGKENEDVQKALLRVQAALTLVQSIDAVGDSIESFKSLKNVILESSVATNIATASTKAYELAGKAAAATQKFLASPIESTKAGLKGFGEGLKNVGGALKNSLGSLKDFGSNLKGNISSGLKSFGDGVKNIGPNLKKMKDGIGTSEVAFKGLRGAIIGTGIGALVIGITMLIANFDKVKQVVLNLFPGLKGLADFISGLVQGITDFLGITSEAEREAEKLNASSQKRQKSAENEIELMKARGATDREIYVAERKLASDRIKDLEDIRKKKKKLTEEEQQEYEDLIQKRKVLDAAETKRQNDIIAERAKKLKEEAEEKEKQEAAAAKAAAEKRAAERKAAGEAFNNVVAKLNEELLKLNKSSYEVQRIDAQKAYDADLKILETAKSKGAITVKQYNEAILKLEANKAAKVKAITEQEGKDAQKILESNQAALDDMLAGFDNASVEQRQKTANAKLDAAKQAQLDELAIAEANAVEALKLQKGTDEQILALQQQYIDLRKGLDAAYATAKKESNAEIVKSDADALKSQADDAKAKEQQRIKDVVEANDKTNKLTGDYYDELAKIYDDDSLSFKEKEKAKLALTEQYNSDILAENKRRIEEEIALQEASGNGDKKRLEELRVALKKVNADIAKDADEQREKERQAKLDSAKELVEGVQQFVDILSGLGDAISELYQAQMDEIDALTEKQIEASNAQKDAELANKELTSEEKNAIEERYQREQLQIQAKAEEDKKALQKKQADIQFAIQIANIITATALAVIQALAQLGPVAGAVAGVLIGATGLAQIAVAKKQRDSVMALAKGGLVTGPGTGTSDSIPARLSNGEAVINAQAVRRFAPILSAINQSTGGVPIEAPKFALGGTASDALLLGINDRLNSIAATQVEQAPTRAYVLDTDVSSSTVKNNRIRRTSTY